ncbi:MAG: hypothetical protein HXY25_00770 [Alphaproteobacteria bacterium]|nr:hypothetical protein [Alphaproteobacteria bacterium]
MRIRTFHGASIGEAMARVREAMGADAIILSTHEHRRGGGVEVKAATEGPAETPRAADPAYSALASRLAARLDAELRAALPPGAAPTVLPSPPRLGTAELRGLYHCLAAQGLSRPLMARALKAARDAGGHADGALGAGLEAALAFEPLSLRPHTAHVLVGPPGMGKTAALAKLAATAVLTGERPVILSTDTLRAGALAQIEAYAGVIGLGARACESPEAFAEALLAAGAAPVLADTPGTNPRKPSELKDLRRFLGKGRLDPVLVIAAGTDPREAVALAAPFHEIGARRFLLTRIDTAERLGSLVEALVGAGLSLAGLGGSPYLADGLEPASGAGLARALLDRSPPPPPGDALAAASPARRSA